ncbi:MAG: response regulator transcription factor [Proteobacteria bacterium]|nr:response regulator transcription factor [Pseudomonadota bacterium]
MVKKILVVDDEEDILELIKYNLEKDGYAVTCATSGENAVKIAGSTSFDIILLDLMLPGIDGLEVAKKLKKNTKTEHVPIIMLTAKGEESDIVTGLELGADDYMTKPFSPKVLTARIKSVLRRKDKSPNDKDYIIDVHGFLIDSGRREVTVHGTTVDLTYTEFQILQFLANNPGWVFSRNQIVDAVRGEGYAVTDRSVDVQVAGIRKKLGEYGKYIETVRGVGYRFTEDQS